METRTGNASELPPAAQDPKRGTAEQAAALAASDPTQFGRQLYARHCAACHGERGDGLGIAAAYLFPKPRDLRVGRFRLVSTSNNVPSGADLHGVLLRGMPGSIMPPWAHLAQNERDALVSEVMRLRREGAQEQYIAVMKEQEGLTDEQIAAEDVQAGIREYVESIAVPGDSTQVPEFSPSTAEALARGKEVYAKSGCLQCHGSEGKGDGVQKMVDEEKLPTAPRDFTLGIFKGGHDPASLYRRIAYGMPGTPMPSSSQLSAEQMMDLVHYIRSMSTEDQRQAAVLNRAKIGAVRVAALPDSPRAAAWSAAPVVRLRMTPLWWRNHADPDLHVQSVHDGRRIAIRLSWNDAVEDGHAISSQSFEDAVAMQLYRGDSEPFLGMGGSNAPVDVWFWDADRQSPTDVEDQYPNVVADIYPFSEQSVATAEYRREGTRRSAQPEVSLPALASGNQIVPGRAPTGGSDLAVGGPGSVTFRMPQSQLVDIRGQWEEGRWTVVMSRTLMVTSEQDRVSLEPGSRASVAFAIWDGSRQDRDGKKLITIWQDLELQE
ncbi:MAG: c-type cytochrome [Planctomycetes bacterium]|nr:c-type cytochrome [Planctomycetota bacterium]